jgi:WD40 repeat protein
MIMLQRLHLAYSPSRRRFALALGAQTVRIWELESSHRHDGDGRDAPEDGYGLELDTRTGGLLGVCFIADNVLITIHAEGAVRAWLIESVRQTSVDNDPYAGWMHEASSADKPIVVGGWSQMPPGTRRQAGPGLSASLLWELDVRARLQCCELQHETAGWRQARVALGGASGEVLLLDIFARRAPELRKLGQLKSPIVRAVLTEDGSCMATAGRDRAINVWQLHDIGPEERTQGPWRTFEGSEGEIWAMAFSHSGRYLVSGGIDNGIYFWDLLAKNALRAVSHDHRGWIGSLAWSDDDHVIASASWDNTVGLFRAGDLMPLYCFEHHRDYAAQVVFIPDTSWLVSASYDRTLAVWDWYHAEQVRSFEGHNDWVQSVRWMGQGQLVSASSDKTLRLWSVNALRCVRVLGDKRATEPEPVSLGAGLSETSMSSMARRADKLGSSFPVYRSSGFGDQRVRAGGAGIAPQQVIEAVEAAQAGCIGQEVSVIVDDAPMLAALMGRGPRRASISPEELSAELSSPRAPSQAREARAEHDAPAPDLRQRQDTGSQRWRVWVEELPGAQAPAPIQGDTTLLPGRPAVLPARDPSNPKVPAPSAADLAALGSSVVTEESGLLLVETALRFHEMSIQEVEEPAVEELGATKSYELEPIELGQRVPSAPIWEDDTPSMEMPGDANALSAPLQEEDGDAHPLFDLPEDDGPLPSQLRLVAHGAPEQGLRASLAPIPTWGDDRSGLLPLADPAAPMPAPPVASPQHAPKEADSAAQAPKTSEPPQLTSPPVSPAASSLHASPSSTFLGAWPLDDSEPRLAPVSPSVTPAASQEAAEPLTSRSLPSLQSGNVRSRLLGKLRAQEAAPEPVAPFEPPAQPHMASSPEPPVELPVEPPQAVSPVPASKTAEFPVLTLPAPPKLSSPAELATPPWEPWGEEPSEAKRVHSARTTSEEDAQQQPAPATPLSGRTTSEEDAQPVLVEKTRADVALVDPGLDFTSLEEGTSIGPVPFSAPPVIEAPPSEFSQALHRAHTAKPAARDAFANHSQTTRQKTAPGGHNKLSSGTPVFGSPAYQDLDPDPVEIVDLLAEQTSAASAGDLAQPSAPTIYRKGVARSEAVEVHPAAPRAAIPFTSVAELWSAATAAQRPAMMIMKRKQAPPPTGVWRIYDRVKTPLSAAFTASADEDKRLMVLGGRSRDLIAYNARLEPLWDVHVHGSMISAALILSAARVVVAGGDDGLVHLWALAIRDRDKPSHHAVLDGHAGPITRVVAGPSGKVLLSGSEDATARIWSLEDGRPVATLRHDSAVRALAFGVRGPITADERPVVRVWDNRGILLDLLEGFPAPVTALANHKTALYVGCADGSVFLCSPNKRERLPLQHRGAIRHIQLLPGGEQLAITHAGGLLQLLVPGETVCAQQLDIGEPLEQATLVGQSLVIATTSGALEQLCRR